jgi:hypothetical protein
VVSEQVWQREQYSMKKEGRRSTCIIGSNEPFLTSFSFFSVNVNIGSQCSDVNRSFVFFQNVAVDRLHHHLIDTFPTQSTNQNFFA